MTLIEFADKHAEGLWWLATLALAAAMIVLCEFATALGRRKR